MKKVLLLLFVSFTIGAQAQFQIGVNLGLPLGDYGDFYRLSFGGDLVYLAGEPDKFLQFGVATGYLHYLGQDVEIGNSSVSVNDAGFIPIAAAGRINLLKIIQFGVDVGYGLSLNDTFEGGLYWRGVAGLNFGNKIGINLIYHGISQKVTDLVDQNSSLNSFGLGVLYEFGG